MIKLLSTWLDVVDLIPQLLDEDGNLMSIKSKANINSAIFKADSYIRTRLRRMYGDSLLAKNPWFQPPLIGKGNSNGQGSTLAPSSITLDAALAITDVIKIEFTSTTEFDVTSEASGSLGSGDTGTEFTGGSIVIDETGWTGSFNMGDVIYIRTYVSDPTVALILSAPLAAADLLDHIYTDQIPNSLDTAGGYRGSAMEEIKNLLTHKSFLEREPVILDLDPEKVPYEIDDLGQDRTVYSE